MTGRLPADPAPGPPEDYAARFATTFLPLRLNAPSFSPLL